MINKSTSSSAIKRGRQTRLSDLQCHLSSLTILIPSLPTSSLISTWKNTTNTVFRWIWKTTFEEINKAYNPGLEWDIVLAEDAYEEALKAHSIQDVDLKIRAAKKFLKSDNRTLEEKVRLTLRHHMARRKMQLQAFAPWNTLRMRRHFQHKGRRQPHGGRLPLQEGANFTAVNVF
ncbi:hypothetical protein OSTOST_08661 [Ostertagia ostertagi]